MGLLQYAFYICEFCPDARLIDSSKVIKFKKWAFIGLIDMVVAIWSQWIRKDIAFVLDGKSSPSNSLKPCSH